MSTNPDYNIPDSGPVDDELGLDPDVDFDPDTLGDHADEDEEQDA